MLLAIVGWLGTPAGGRAARSDALWHVVHGLCVRDRKLTGLAAPCLKVDLEQGYAIVPDPKKRFHLLLSPTRRLTGIEDPALLEPGAPNYWSLAWNARGFLQARLGRPLPREAVGLAVNGIAGRSQDQLHIHISCIKPQVSQALDSIAGRIGDRWSNQRLLGWRWRIRRLAGADLDGADPFQLLPLAAADVAARMGDQTLVAVPTTGPRGKGFYLLTRTTEADEADPGHGESLLDEACLAVRAS